MIENELMWSEDVVYELIQQLGVDNDALSKHFSLEALPRRRVAGVLLPPEDLECALEAALEGSREGLEVLGAVMEPRSTLDEEDGGKDQCRLSPYLSRCAASQAVPPHVGCLMRYEALKQISLALQIPQRSAQFDVASARRRRYDPLVSAPRRGPEWLCDLSRCASSPVVGDLRGGSG